MKLRFTLRATADLEAIADYLNERSPAAALRVRADILGSMRMLTLFPESGRPQLVEGVRKLVSRRYRYLVYYAPVSGEELAILSIQHPAKDRAQTDR